jgi:hypothetical protein
MSSFLEGFASLEGLRVPGGCDDCDAYQVVDCSHAPFFRINIHHDDTCPSYRAMQEKR